jgi:excisionase family DNA binding protein
MMGPSSAESVLDGRLWTVEELSVYLGIPVPTLYRWRRYRCGLPAHRIVRHLRYVPDEVAAWLREQS